MPSNNFALLEKIETVEDLKGLTVEELPHLSQEIRQFMLQHVSMNGGHLGSSLGAVDLTLAFHYLFTSPNDKIHRL